MPGGYRLTSGSFLGAGYDCGSWWTATEHGTYGSSDQAYGRSMAYHDDSVNESSLLKDGWYSVRCVEGE